MRGHLQTATTATALLARAVSGDRRAVLNAADLDARTRQSAERRLRARARGLRLGAARGPQLAVHSVDAARLRGSFSGEC